MTWNDCYLHPSRNAIQKISAKEVVAGLIIGAQILGFLLVHSRLSSFDFGSDLVPPSYFRSEDNSNPHTESPIALFNPEEHRDKALEYVKSLRDFTRPLGFFHIPKTAGTAIENSAGEQNINWGSCMFNHKPKRDICTYPGKQLWPMRIGWWHLPMHAFPIANTDPYQNHEIFAVVRDPYDRMVSEFYYICSLKIKSWRPDQCNRSKLLDPEYMNQWLSEKLLSQENGTVSGFMLDNGHFTPQYEFLVGPNEVRRVDHVLRLDDGLGLSFDTLVSAYSLDFIKLHKFHALGAAKGTAERAEGTHLGIQHLSPTTVNWVHRRYSGDFHELRYKSNKTASSSI